ncbi:MAG TPA: hypothetical protein RMH99_10860 [Sandaracinaceae bacterium LLY-WYZ-13_1]|nr:hypothetical protein [Sandaracinaceae bacterium LLY-WYZ-13_1]
MRRAVAWLAALALLAGGCDAVVGLDGYCVLDPGESPETARCRRAWPQCGCASGETCDGVEARCRPAGAIPLGARCDGTDEACAEGGNCVSLAAEVGRCHAFCEPGDDASCAVMGPTSFCVGLEDRAFGLCTASCTPGRDEETCGPGLVCDVRSPDRTFCRPVGTQELADPCDLGGQACAAGLTCTVNDDGEDRCFVACGPGFAACPVGARCYREDPDDRSLVEPAAPDEWGVCLLD